jgi:hypothetical protein
MFTQPADARFLVAAAMVSMLSALTAAGSFDNGRGPFFLVVAVLEMMAALFFVARRCGVGNKSD